jgi:gas vesicle protein
MGDNSARDVGIGILIGAALGVVVGLMFAPKSGAETRAMLKDKVAGLKGRMMGRQGGDEIEEAE